MSSLRKDSNKIIIICIKKLKTKSKKLFLTQFYPHPLSAVCLVQSSQVPHGGPAPAGQISSRAACRAAWQGGKEPSTKNKYRGWREARLSCLNQQTQKEIGFAGVCRMSALMLMTGRLSDEMPYVTVAGQVWPEPFITLAFISHFS